jgi:xanthine dehydrogenase YagR molybdenum-binding subunit
LEIFLLRFVFIHGVHFVEVRWDPGISRLRVARVVSAIDVGKVVNPLAARNQVE